MAPAGPSFGVLICELTRTSFGSEACASPLIKIVLMILVALALLSLAVLIGLAIGARFLGDGCLPSRAVGAVHGLLGASGLSALILALVSGTGTGDRYGTASFGPAAAILAALAALAGAGIAILGRKASRSIGFLIGAHASLAVAAYVLLLAYALLT